MSCEIRFWLQGADGVGGAGRGGQDSQMICDMHLPPSPAVHCCPRPSSESSMMHVANPAACFLSQHAVVANVNAGQVQDISFKKEVCARLANITKVSRWSQDGVHDASGPTAPVDMVRRTVVFTDAEILLKVTYDREGNQDNHGDYHLAFIDSLR
jgi:hypothetical protein